MVTRRWLPMTNIERIQLQKLSLQFLFSFPLDNAPGFVGCLKRSAVMILLPEASLAALNAGEGAQGRTQSPELVTLLKPKRPRDIVYRSDSLSPSKESPEPLSEDSFVFRSESFSHARRTPNGLPSPTNGT